MELVSWEAGRIDDVVTLWNRWCPSEPLTAQELATALDGCAVVAIEDGHQTVAVVAFAQGADEARYRGNVRLLAVAPEARRRGLGRALLTAAQSRLRERGVTSIRLAGGVPRYLWPGIDQANEAALALATSAGYRVVDHAVNMSMDTSFRAPLPPGVHLRGATVADTADLHGLVARNWPLWLTEVELATQRGTLFGAWVGPQLVGFIAHSTMRQGWIGPMGTDASFRNRGVGAALLAAVCGDLAHRGYLRADIAWVGPVRYFAALGARVGRRFDRLSQDWS